MSGDLHTKVREWLLNTGFPLEMRAAAAFRAAGFNIRQSASYVDPESEKGREIDVVASHPEEVGVVRISFVMECKASQKPWVVLSSNTTLNSYNRLLAFCLTSEAARSAVARLLPGRHATSSDHILVGDRAGYALRQALGDKEDAGYAAAMSALKGANDQIREREPGGMLPLCFSFPVVVVDTPLFECTLGEDGQLELAQVPRVTFLFSAHVPRPVGCLVHVVTAAHLMEFAAWAAKVSTDLRTDLGEHEADAL